MSPWASIQKFSIWLRATACLGYVVPSESFQNTQPLCSGLKLQIRISWRQMGSAGWNWCGSDCAKTFLNTIPSHPALLRGKEEMRVEINQIWSGWRLPGSSGSRTEAGRPDEDKFCRLCLKHKYPNNKLMQALKGNSGDSVVLPVWLHLWHHIRQSLLVKSSS